MILVFPDYIFLYPVSSLYKSIAGRCRPVRIADGPVTARSRCLKNASWVLRDLLTCIRNTQSRLVQTDAFWFLGNISSCIQTSTYKSLNEDTQEMPQSQNTAFQRHQVKKRWGTSNDKGHLCNRPHTNKEELEQRTRPVTVSRKTAGWLRGLKTTLLARNLALYSEAAPNYKHMFNLNKSHLPQQWNITAKHWDET